MKTYELSGNLEGFTYQQLLNWALEECYLFSLVTRHDIKPSQKNEINERLQPFLIEEQKVNEWPGTKVFGPAEHALRFYKLNRSSVKILSEANSVYSWLAPDKPEDLAFYRSKKDLWFGSVAHENMAFFSDPNFNKNEVTKRLIDTSVLN